MILMATSLSLLMCSCESANDETENQPNGKIDEKSNSEAKKAFNLINDVAMEHRSFKPNERDVITHDINLYFSSQIASLRDEAKLGQQDIMLMFCNILGIDQELTADIMCTSRSNMRSIKSRLKSKVSPETFSLYFKE